MRRFTRWGLAAAIVASMLTSMGVPASAATASSGLQVKIVSYDWVPRTGNLEVTARVDCPRQIWSASWSMTVKQRVSAKGLKKISCTGQPQRLTLVLDPKNGRFHPGAATQEMTTVECISDICLGVIYPTRDFRIPPPGHTVRGAR